MENTANLNIIANATVILQTKEKLNKLERNTKAQLYLMKDNDKSNHGAENMLLTAID